MYKSTLYPVLVLLGGILAGWLLVRFALPLLFPFLLGAGLALAAEPMVRLLDRRLGLRRWFASGVGVCSVFVLLLTLLVLLGAVLVKQAGRLTTLVPELTRNVTVGMDSLESWLLRVASGAPQGVRSVLTNTVTGFFSDGSAMMGNITAAVPGLLSKTFSHAAEAVFTLATAVLAAFMISAKLPRLRQLLQSHIPQSWKQTYLPVLSGLRKTVTGWLLAQAKLTLVVMGLLALCFWLLKLPNSLLWAVVISVVDALPVLGCGIVLVPWSLICLLQGQRLRCLGLLGTYVLIWLVRSVLEPRLLGRELGLDPLVTLLSIYVGYRLLGVPGMILAPLAAVVLTKATSALLKKGEIPPKSP